MDFSRRSFVGAVCAVGATVSVAAAERPLTLPRRLYTPETIAGLKAKPVRNPLGLTLWSAREAPGLAALKARSLDDLDRFIPLTPPAVMWTPENLCPFCGARWELKGRSYIDMTMGRAYAEILDDPYALTTACCKLRIPEDEADWPTGGRWATRNTIAVPHLDGVTRAYTFLVPPSDVGKAFATVPVRKGRDTWFCPAMDVWSRRMVCLRDRLIPSLAAVALKNPDAATRAAARRLLVRIFVRLAEVLPRGTVCQSSACDIGYGLARSPKAAGGRPGYLTAAEYRATPRHRRPSWHTPAYYSLGVFGSSATGNWQNGVFATFAQLLEAWDVVRDSAEAQPFVAQIQKGVVDELGFCLSWSLPSQGNTEYVWYDAATRVAVALQDPWYLNFAIDRIRDTGISEVYADGLVTEGALRPYAGLVCNNFRFADRLRQAGIFDLYAELPRVEHAAARTEQACRTLWGGTVSPGDDMAQGWLPSTAAWGGKPSEKPDYGRFRGENYPDWGLLMLRCGGVSNRLEICMDNAKHDGHGHNARLNLELFYEGTPLMPELGYCQTTLAYDRGFGLELKERYARERGLPFCTVPKPNPSHPGQWGLWYAYGGMDLTHVSAAIDWTLLGPYGRRDYAAWTPRFATAESPDGPEGFAQFAEGALDSLGRAYRRQLAAITLPSGGALALDFYRLAGGRRHQTFAHAFSPKAGEPVAYAGLDLKLAPFADYAAYAAANGCDLQTNAAYSARAVFYPYLRDLRTAASGNAAWRMTFRCRPGAYAPLTDAGRAFFDTWVPKAVPDVDFDLWGASAGSPAATQVLTMKGPNVMRQQEKASHPRGYQGYLIPFDGLLDIVSEVRTAPTDGLKSCFARVYSPRRAEGQAPAVRRVEPLGEGAVKVETADGTLYAAATESDTGRFASGGFALTGRFGAVLPDQNLIRLYDGESVALEAGGRIWRAKVAPTQHLRLREVVGDVSGRPQEHALIVAGGDLPTDDTWKGRWITVEHPGCRVPSDSYEVAAISRIADGVYRVDLAEKPTFVTFRAKVSSIERQADGSVVYKADRWNNKEEHAKGFGGRIHFTRTGWTPDYAIVAAKGRGGAYRVEATPPDGQAPRVGDVFTLSRIRAGDTVVFPSSLAARGRDDGRGGVAFEVVATGPYEVSAQAAPSEDGEVTPQSSALTLTSPDGRLSATVDPSGPVPVLTLMAEGRPSGRLAVGPARGAYGFAMKTASVRDVRHSWRPVWGFKSVYPDNYAEAEIAWTRPGDGATALTVWVRAYDEGFAVRYGVQLETYGLDEIAAERTGFTPPAGTVCWPISGTEDTYPKEPIAVAALDTAAQWRMPLTMRTPDGLHLSVLEAATENWPRSHLVADGKGGFGSVFVRGTKLGREYAVSPWRAVLVAPSAGGLIERAYLVENLNPPCAVPDAEAWVRPGLCTRDFGQLQNAALLVDADRAKEAAGVRYLQLDWGWYGTERPWSDAERAAYAKLRPDLVGRTDWIANTSADPFSPARGYVPYHPSWTNLIHYGRKNVNLDIPALVRDLKARGMGLCLYLHGLVLEKTDLEKLFAQYESWGVAGLKPGFVSYGSQDATEALRRLAACAAKHHLWLDIHDAHIPDGFERTWPNVMISEGGGGEEGSHPVRQDCALPFTRCLAGPFDYTPRFFQPSRTRVHAAAMTLVYPGPTAVLRWSVGRSVAETVAASGGVFDFVKRLPMNYDETVVPDAEVARRIVVARRRGGTWYLGGLCGESPATTRFRLDFLDEGRAYALDLWRDDVIRETRTARRGDELSIDMLAGGGLAGVLTPCAEDCEGKGEAGAHTAPFADGDRIVFWGDSITHGGFYPQLLSDFYLTRYPDRAVRFYNAGVSGDSAGVARARFEEDVRRRNPTVVTLMFGMNDSGRGMYDPVKMADAAYRTTIPAREAACRAAYETNLTELVRCIRAELPQARLMFLTPTPYDETAVQTGPDAVPALKGTAASLARFAAFGRKLAAETGSGVVDWTASVSALVAAEQAKDPSFSFVNRDRVHPGAPGHLFLTCEFLKAQGATNPVSDVAISAQDGLVIRADNATVSGFARTADGCAFTVLARALPWVVPTEAESALAYTPAFAELSREGLAVAGLTPDAVYALRIDGAEVGAWTGAALAHGIDLGRNAKTPQSRQAAEVGRLNAARCAIERDQLRMFAASRRFLRLRGVDPDDFAAVRTYCDGLTEAAQKGYFQRRLPDYLRDYGRKDEIERDQDVRWAELLKRRMPQPHRYEVVRLTLHAKDGKGKGEIK